MTSFFVLLVIAVGLAIDCFTVSLCIGSSPRPLEPRSVLRLSFHFGLFQGGMAFLGWLLGSSFVSLIEQVDHWLALLLLAWVGVRMIAEGFAPQDEAIQASCEDRTRGRSLVMLSIATSIDAFGVGLSLAFMDANILVSSLLIGTTSLLLSIIGLLSGKKIGQHFGKKAEIAGGFVLLLIGLRIVIAHTIG